jgi:biopolymer transport protein ExbD
MSMQAAKRGIFSEINITPLTDIFLVLLIIMMVVAPMMQQQRADIKPPSLSSGATSAQGKVVVEVTQKGEYFVNGKVATPDTLAQQLTELKPTSNSGEKTVVLRADKTSRSGAVVAVLQAAKEAAYDKVTVAGQQGSGTNSASATASTVPQQPVIPATERP